MAKGLRQPLTSWHKGISQVGAILEVETRPAKIPGPDDDDGGRQAVDAPMIKLRNEKPAQKPDEVLRKEQVFPR